MCCLLDFHSRQFVKVFNLVRDLIYNLQFHGGGIAIKYESRRVIHAFMGLKMLLTFYTIKCVVFLFMGKALNVKKSLNFDMDL